MKADYEKLAYLSSCHALARSEVIACFVEEARRASGPCYTVRSSGALEEVVIRYDHTEVIRIAHEEILGNPFGTLKKVIEQIDVHKKEVNNGSS